MLRINISHLSVLSNFEAFLSLKRLRSNLQLDFELNLEVR